MPKACDPSVGTPRRRSVRQKPAKKEPPKVAPLPDISDDEVRMPPGYNPSDDSEEEYIPQPQVKKMKVSLAKVRATNQISGSDSEPEEEENQKKARSSKKSVKGRGGRSSKSVISKPQNNTPTSKTAETVTDTKNGIASPSPVTKIPASVTAKSEIKKEKEENILCPFPGCSEKLKIDGNARFHLSVHYYDEGKFTERDILVPEDPDENGRAKDEKGLKIKYNCPYDRCTKRKMGHKEMCVHLATQHQMLESLMVEADPAIQRIKKILYPSTLDDVKVKVKSEPVLPEADQEDPDDPDNPDDPPAKVTLARSSDVKPLTSVVVNKNVTPARVIQRPRVERIMNCFMCKDKEGRNMSSQQDIKYHCAVCAYGTGEFLKYVPHHQGAGKEKMSDLEEFGSLWRYKCPFEGCDKNTGRAKSIGYKEFAIHCGVMHGVLERWAGESELDGAQELHKTLQSWREAEGKELPEMPEVKVEEMHICYICNGADKEGKNLSLAPEKIYSTRYHYASCLYDSKVYYDMYDPSDQNKNPDGSPRDILGREVKYNCNESACSNRKRRMGYKEFAIHQANEHKGLEQVLRNHPDERLRSLVPKLARR